MIRRPPRSTHSPYTTPFRSPSCVHSRTYTGRPSTGSPLTVADRLVPCPWLYTLKLPTPVVPTDIEYCTATTPALPIQDDLLPGNFCFGDGLVITALLWFAAD